MKEIKRIREITIMVNKQSEGYTFDLHPLSLKEVREYSPMALRGAIFVSYDTKIDFEIFQDNVLPRVIEILTNMDNEKLLHIDIKLIIPYSGEEIYINNSKSCYASDNTVLEIIFAEEENIDARYWFRDIGKAIIEREYLENYHILISKYRISIVLGSRWFVKPNYYTFLGE